MLKPLLQTALLIFSTVCYVPPAVFASQENSGQSKPLPEYSLVYSAGRDPFQDATDALNLAKLTRRQVFIEVGGNWCQWCMKFDRLLRSTPELSAAFYDRFVVLKINVSDENKNQTFMDGLPAFSGYPHFFVSNADGNIILSQSPTEFVQAGEFMPVRIMDFIHNEDTDKSF